MQRGLQCKISKMYIISAYKIAPSHPSAWRLQDFQQLKIFLLIPKLTLDQKAAPSHFDCIGFVLALLACSISKKEKK